MCVCAVHAACAGGGYNPYGGYGGGYRPYGAPMLQGSAQPMMTVCVVLNIAVCVLPITAVCFVLNIAVCGMPITAVRVLLIMAVCVCASALSRLGGGSFS